MLQRDLRQSLPAAGAAGGTISDVRGGVLADEMGLGKTVTVGARARGPGGRRTQQRNDARRVRPARAARSNLMEKRWPTRPKESGGAASRGVLCGTRPTVVCAFCGAVAHKACSEQRAAPAQFKGAPSENGASVAATLVVCPAAIAGSGRGISETCAFATSGGVPGRAARPRAHRPRSKPTTPTTAGLCNPSATAYGAITVQCYAKLMLFVTFGALRADRYYQPAPHTPQECRRLLTNDGLALGLPDEQLSEADAACGDRRAQRCERWCVSGTPIAAGGLEDVRALYDFLVLHPFWRQWREAVGLRAARRDSLIYLKRRPARR